MVISVKILYRVFLGGCILSALAVPVMLVLGFRAEVGLPAILFFLTSAVGVRGIPALKGFTFTILIFAGLTAAMFYPMYFVELGGFQLKRLIIPLMQIIMFGMGTALSLNDFIGVVKMPKGVFVGLLCQFSIMPLVGFSLATLFHFPPEISAGVVLIGSTPCGLASNVMNYIAGSNLALSVTLTAVSTIIAPIMTPFMMKVLAGQMVPIDFFDMMLAIIKIVIVPIIFGLIFNKVAHGRAKWLDRTMPIVSMAGIIYIVPIAAAAGRDNLLTVGFALIFAGILHNTLGYIFGYWGARVFRMDEKSCRTIAIEVGLQNGGLAQGISLEMGKIGTMGLASIVFGTWMNISGSSLANWWRGRPVRDE